MEMDLVEEEKWNLYHMTSMDKNYLVFLYCLHSGLEISEKVAMNQGIYK